MRNVLKYPGSKWRIADKLVELIPPHHSYLEPYFGSGAVFFRKEPSDIETVNDLDNDVANLFWCIQQDPEKLARLVMTTPYSRQIYDDSYKDDPISNMLLGLDSYHKACQFLIRCWQGHGFRTNGYKVGWKNDVQGREPSIALPCFVDMNYGAGIKQAENARAIQGRYYKGVCGRSGETSGVAIPINEDILLSGNNYNQRKVIHPETGISRTLVSNGHSGNEPKVAIPVLTPDREKKRQNGRRFKEDGEPMFTLTGQDRHGVAIKVKNATKQGYVIAQEGDSINHDRPGSSTRRGRVGKQIANTLDTSCNQGIFVQVSDELTAYAIWYEKYQCYIAIRRLTPKECFRLQGWDDDYFEKAQFVNSDSQLYKQAGNGVTVNVVHEIGKALAY